MLAQSVTGGPPHGGHAQKQRHFAGRDEPHAMDQPASKKPVLRRLDDPAEFMLRHALMEFVIDAFDRSAGFDRPYYPVKIDNRAR